YCMVALSFIILRSKEPDLKRPYKVKHYKLVGTLAVLMSGFMVAMYIIPNSGCSLVPQEWVMVGGWSLLGVVFFIICKVKYKEKFATLVDIVDEDEIEEKKEEESAAAEVVSVAKSREGAVEAQADTAFSYYLPVNIEFGCEKVDQAGSLAKPYGKNALI